MEVSTQPLPILPITVKLESSGHITGVELPKNVLGEGVQDQKSTVFSQEQENRRQRVELFHLQKTCVKRQKYIAKLHRSNRYKEGKIRNLQQEISNLKSRVSDTSDKPLNEIEGLTGTTRKIKLKLDSEWNIKKIQQISDNFLKENRRLKLEIIRLKTTIVELRKETRKLRQNLQKDEDPDIQEIVRIINYLEGDQTPLLGEGPIPHLAPTDTTVFESGEFSEITNQLETHGLTYIVEEVDQELSL